MDSLIRKTIFTMFILQNNCHFNSKNVQLVFFDSVYLRYRSTLRFDFIDSFMVFSTAPISDTRDPEISRFSIAHAYQYKTKQQTKTKRIQNKIIFAGLSLYSKAGIADRP